MKRHIFQAKNKAVYYIRKLSHIDEGWVTMHIHNGHRYSKDLHWFEQLLRLFTLFLHQKNKKIIRLFCSLIRNLCYTLFKMALFVSSSYCFSLVHNYYKCIRPLLVYKHDWMYLTGDFSQGNWKPQDSLWFKSIICN